VTGVGFGVISNYRMASGDLQASWILLNTLYNHSRVETSVDSSILNFNPGREWSS